MQSGTVNDIDGALAEALAPVSWHRINVRLRNIRNTLAREHPLSVFHSLLRWADPDSERGRSSFVFHPRTGRFADRIEKDRVYDLTVVFPSASFQEIDRFTCALLTHLQNPLNNFEVIDIGAAERRTPNSTQDFPVPDVEGDLWLDFVGRLDFDPSNGSHNWRIDAGALFNLMAARLQSLFGMDLEPFRALWEGIRITSWYWEHRRSTHTTRSSSGTKYIQGREGPILLHNVPGVLWPVIAACSELHIGRETTYGRGFYRMVSESDFLDNRIRDPQEIRRTIGEVAENSDLADKLDRSYFEREEIVSELADELGSRSYRPEAARMRMLPKKAGGTRSICTLSAKDHIVHRHLFRILQPAFDRMFEDCSVGYRPGRSVQTAKKIIDQALADGCRFVVESDIEAFFDEIDWEVLEAKLDQALPPGEPLTRGLIAMAIRMEVEGQKGESCRTKGLLQGSPLSPLLSNLYLDAFDEKMLAADRRLVRYADDFVILARSHAEAEQALSDARAILAEEKLTLKGEKTRLGPVDLGFSFLGAEFGGLESDFVEKMVLRKPLYISPSYGFIGIDYDSVIVKRGTELIRRIPLRRVREMVILGSHTISTRLLQRCSFEKIPVTFCSPSGGYMNTLAPDSKRFHDVEARHALRYHVLLETDRVRVAASIAAAKVHNYREWIIRRFGPEGSEAAAQLGKALSSIPDAQSLEEVRGHEGYAARSVFRLVADLAAAHGFQSEGRVPYKKKDHLNSLLDFAYFLLTARLNMLIRGKGLNPYLGFLHSAKDHYESLVYDLAEPFRFRMDALVLRIINQGVIKKEDFTRQPDKGERYFLSSNRAGHFIEVFEREMLSTRGSGGNSLANLLEAQVHHLLRWVDEGVGLRLYRK